MDTNNLLEASLVPVAVDSRAPFNSRGPVDSRAPFDSRTPVDSVAAVINTNPALEVALDVEKDCDSVVAIDSDAKQTLKAINHGTGAVAVKPDVGILDLQDIRDRTHDYDSDSPLTTKRNVKSYDSDFKDCTDSGAADSGNARPGGAYRAAIYALDSEREGYVIVQYSSISKGELGPSGAGVALFSGDCTHRPMHIYHGGLGFCDIVTGEFRALILALSKAKEKSYGNIVVEGTSPYMLKKFEEYVSEDDFIVIEDPKGLNQSFDDKAVSRLYEDAKKLVESPLYEDAKKLVDSFDSCFFRLGSELDCKYAIQEAKLGMFLGANSVEEGELYPEIIPEATLAEMMVETLVNHGGYEDKSMKAIRP